MKETSLTFKAATLLVLVCFKAGHAQVELQLPPQSVPLFAEMGEKLEMNNVMMDLMIR